MAFRADAGSDAISIAAEAGTDSRGDSRRADGRGEYSERKHCSASPIFLHSSWRASHTWFWLKFREHPSTLCFYEPFHESLATVTRSEALSLGPHSWNSRHPAGEPYLLEFIPLIRKAGGVRLFTPEVSYRWFLPDGRPTGDLHPAETKYLTLLLRHAERCRRIPVFGFTRSLGRLAVMKKRFPGIHIFQYRNLWTQWMSWIDHKSNNNNYFFRKLLQIMIETEHPYLSAILKRYMARRFQCAGDNDSEILSNKLVGTLDEQDLFSLYMAFHTFVYMCARQNADIVVDTTKVARDENYRNQTCRQLTAATGFSISFEDICEVQRYQPFDPALINWEEVRENLKSAVLTLDHLFDPREALRYGTELLDETLAEIEASEKYVATARDEMTRLTSERDTAAAARSTLAAQRDRLADERDGLLAERDRLSEQYGAATAEIGRLAGELAAANADREGLIAENARLRSEVALAIGADAQLASGTPRGIEERHGLGIDCV